MTGSGLQFCPPPFDLIGTGFSVAGTAWGTYNLATNWQNATAGDVFFTVYGSVVPAFKQPILGITRGSASILFNIGKQQ